jgi:hypothetical protein
MGNDSINKFWRECADNIHKLDLRCQLKKTKQEFCGEFDGQAFIKEGAEVSTLPV